MTDYGYDTWGNLTSTTYSDGTPSVTLSYDALGRLKTANDVAGTTTYTYDAFGDETQITTSGLYSKTIVRHRDSFGRDLGHSMDSSRKNVIEYDGETGRIKRTMLGGAWYTWDYLQGTDLKSSLSVGTAATTTWAYEPHRDLLTQVKNTVYGSVASQYDYTNDALGRRTAIARSGTMMSESRSDAYGYNTRSELISAAKNGIDEYAYQYDDIGNRESSVEPDNSSTYTANELNQYDAITSQTSQTSHISRTFIPQYDLDGNQTIVKTKTGIWSVTYNGENRPISWSCGTTNIVMKFDRMGRRVEYIETVRDDATGSVVTNKHQKFAYDGYLCIQRLNGANNAVTDLFEWDPTEPVATRPLFWQPRTAEGNFSLFYTHDGNKNVSEAVFYQRARGVAAHYEYAPFGDVIVQSRGDAWGSLDLSSINPWRFSSEFADDTLGLVYYNYRHYESVFGRWMRRDPLNEVFSSNRYSFALNNVRTAFDYLGLDVVDDYIANVKKSYEDIKKSKCSFIIAYDNISTTGRKYNPTAVKDRIVRLLKALYPNNQVLIIEDFSAKSFVQTINNTKCICGVIYIGHASPSDRDRPARLIFGQTNSLVSRGASKSDPSVTRVGVDAINGDRFMEGAVSLLLGCRSGVSGNGQKSIAEEFAQAAETIVYGTTDKVNFLSDGNVDGRLFSSPKLRRFDAKGR